MTKRTPPTPTYRSWSAMKARCTNPHNDRWDSYGGRGIQVCERWLTFANFLADMGLRPEGTTLDRFPDQDGNYAPGNCRWATPKEQQNNMRSNTRLTFEGKTLTTAQWAREIGIDAVALRYRLRRGWTIEQALTTPHLEKVPIDAISGRFAKGARLKMQNLDVFIDRILLTGERFQ